MGTGFTIYENFDLFKEVTQLDFNDVRFNQKVRDIYTWRDENKKDHLIVTTDYVREDARPDFEKTVIFLHGDNTKNRFLDDFEGKRLVQWNEIRYEPQKGSNSLPHITFGLKSKWFGLRKVPFMWFPVLYRTNGFTPTFKHNLFTNMDRLPSEPFGVISYDSVRDTINVVKGVWYSELENNDTVM